MITSRMIRIFSFRLWVWEASFQTPFRWNSISKTLHPSPMRNYLAWLLFLGYVTLYLIMTAVRIVSQIWREELNKDFGADLLLNAIFVIVYSMMFLIVGKRTENCTVVNQLFSLDTNLQKSLAHPSNRLQGYSKRRKRLNLNPKWSFAYIKTKLLEKYFPNRSMSAVLVEVLIILVAVVTSLMPFLFGMVFLVEEHEPLRRFVQEMFGWNPRLELKYLPLIAFVVYATGQCCSIITYFVLLGVLYLYSTYCWLTVLIERAASCPMPAVGVVTDRQLVLIYRKLQVLNRTINGIFGHFCMSVHVGALLGMGIATFYGVIKWHDSVPVLTTVLLALAASLTTLAIFVETVLISSLGDKSEEFLRIMSRRNFRKSGVARMLSSCWIIKLHIGKPFDTMGHSTFIVYLETLMSFLTTLLLST